MLNENTELIYAVISFGVLLLLIGTVTSLAPKPQAPPGGEVPRQEWSSIPRAQNWAWIIGVAIAGPLWLAGWISLAAGKL